MVHPDLWYSCYVQLYIVSCTVYSCTLVVQMYVYLLATCRYLCPVCTLDVIRYMAHDLHEAVEHDQSTELWTLTLALSSQTSQTRRCLCYRRRSTSPRVDSTCMLLLTVELTGVCIIISYYTGQSVTSQMRRARPQRPSHPLYLPPLRVLYI